MRYIKNAAQFSRLAADILQGHRTYPIYAATYGLTRNPDCNLISAMTDGKPRHNARLLVGTHIEHIHGKDKGGVVIDITVQRKLKGANWKWRAAPQCHLKHISSPERLLIGGFNLTNSQWDDGAVYILASDGEASRQVINSSRNHFRALWKYWK